MYFTAIILKKSRHTGQKTGFYKKCGRKSRHPFKMDIMANLNAT
jgi:hypothetical protein